MTIKRVEVYFEDKQWWWKTWYHEPHLPAENHGPFEFKYLAQPQAESFCRQHDDQAPGFELIIKTMKGRIGKGHSSKQTYGHDPESSEG